MHDDKRFLSRDRSALLVIDLQESYSGKIFEEARTVTRSQRMLEAARILEIPVLVTEQYPKGLGPTRPEIASHLPEHTLRFEKTRFSCWGAAGLPEALRELSRDQIVIVGIETHVCVNQTAHDMIAEGLGVHLVADAVTSRAPLEHEHGWQKMIDSGAVPTTSECVLFEWLRDAKAAEFKTIHKLVV